MNTTLVVPALDGKDINIELACGETMYVLGANGTGKSSLMHNFYLTNQDKAHRITGHRLTWLQNEETTLSQPKQQLEINRRNHDRHNNAIWKDDSAFNRNLLSLNKLITSENNHNRLIATELKFGDSENASLKALEESAIDTINKLFCYSNMPIVLSLNNENQIVASRNEHTTYPAARLSDGERNALFLITDVMTVPAGTIILIDEPEKHLHRSIVAPLLSKLCYLRPDCFYVVSTHEIQLAAEAGLSKTLLIRGCTHIGGIVNSWDTDLIENSAEIDDGIRRHILGARRKVLFVEGETDSLDKLLYAVLFPDTSVVPMNGSVEVERSVSGLRNTGEEHWVKAAGIIDNDRRSEKEVSELKARGVFALPVHTIESIYYHPSVQKFIAKSMAKLLGRNAEELIETASQQLIDTVRPEARQLSTRVVEKQVCDQIDAKKPSLGEIRAEVPIELNIDVAAMISEEEEKLTTALNNYDIETIICKYPIKKTAALACIAKALGFNDRQRYEECVRKHLIDNSDSLNHVRGFFGELIFHLAIE